MTKTIMMTSKVDESQNKRYKSKNYENYDIQRQNWQKVKMMK